MPRFLKNNITAILNLSKKEIILLIILLIAAILTFTKLSVWMSLIFLSIGIILLIINKVIIIVIKEGEYGKYKNKCNYSCILLGSTTVWKYFLKNNYKNKQLLSYAFFKRSLYADFLILKHKFSYLSESGKVVVTIDCLDIDTSISSKLYFPEFLLFHRVTLKNLKINRLILRYTSSFPLIFYPTYSLKLLRARISHTSHFPDKLELRRNKGNI